MRDAQPAIADAVIADAQPVTAEAAIRDAQPAIADAVSCFEEASGTYFSISPCR